MNDDAASGAQVSHDIVTGKRITAFRVADDHAFRARDNKACPIRLAIGIGNAREKTRGEWRQSFAQADLAEQLIGIRQPKLVKRLTHAHLANFAQGRPETFQRAIQQALAEVG